MNSNGTTCETHALRGTRDAAEECYRQARRDPAHRQARENAHQISRLGA